MAKIDFSRIIDDKFRYYFQMVCIPFVLSVISFLMFIINWISGDTMLMYATLLFSISSIVVMFLAYFFKNKIYLSLILFSINILALFTYFIITSGKGGFSPTWILMLPSCGLLLYGLKWGSILNAVMYLILIFFFWTPIGNSLLQYDYTNTFLIRFPIVYLAFFGIGLLFELLRLITNRERMKVQKKFEELSTRDYLTKLLNRFQFQIDIEKLISEKRHFCIIMFDMDGFKSINDHYGHSMGDEVLIKVANVLFNIRKEETFYRWGGDEFIVLTKPMTQTELKSYAKSVQEAIASLKFSDEDLVIHLSMGCKVINDENITKEQVVDIVDKALYYSKENGKNCITCLDNVD